jgi:hypothetical protein
MDVSHARAIVSHRSFGPIYVAATESTQIAYRQLPFFFGAGYVIVKEELE